MDRIYASGAAAGAPSVPAAPSAGYPTAGNAGTGTLATKPGPYWYHMIMEELMAIITAAGIAPAPGTLNQVKQSLDMLYSPSKIQKIGATVSANALTLTFNPTVIDFRADALSSGVVNSRTVGAAISLVVPSGATLGTVNGQQARLVLIAIDNGGAIELAVTNLAGGVNLDETTLISTTAISAASDSANVIYSANARAGVPFRVAGFVDVTEAAAGSWATAPSTIQGQGGQALAALQSFGYGQTPQAVTGSRALGTTYYNTTGRPISVLARCTFGATGQVLITVAGVPFRGDDVTSSLTGHMMAFVPPGASYIVTAPNGTLIDWEEIR